MLNNDNSTTMTTGAPAAAETAATPAATAAPAAEAQTPPAAQTDVAQQTQALIDQMLAAAKTQQPATTTTQPTASAANTEPAADKSYTQAEMDAALAKAKAEWQAGQQAAPATPAAQATEADIMQHYQQLLAESTASKRKDAALTMIGSDNLPAGVAQLLDYSSDEAMQSSYAAVKEILAASVNEKLRGKTPAGLGSGTNAQLDLAANIAKKIRG